jgi:hypothetical protein
MSTYVLIHGAGHDGSAWDGVIKHLNDLGHKAFGPTAAGHGRRVCKAVTHAESTDNTVTQPFQLWREPFINDADFATASWAYDLLTPEPFQQLLEPLDLKNFYMLDTPKSYLACTEDTVKLPGEWAWHPRMTSRLGLHRLVEMPGSHEVIFSNPTGLAEKLIEAGRD